MYVEFSTKFDQINHIFWSGSITIKVSKAVFAT